jgi:phosphatidylglycerophosphate synthase
MDDLAHLTVAQARQRGQGSAHLEADPTYARTVMRRISPYVTFTIVRFTPLSADAVTALSIISGIAGGILTAIPSLAGVLAALALLQLAYLLDVVDGEVARVRGTSGKRGTYLDLIGHFVQNRALYGGSAFALIILANYAPWAIVIALLGVAFATAFGEQSRMQVLGHGAVSSPHGSRVTGADPMPRSLPARLHWFYRQVAFLWNYPASMNLFCIALSIDAVRMLVNAADPPVALPVFAGGFVLTLALKQLLNALRLLGRSPWERSA